MKTIREYLEMLNEPERSEAIENTLKSRLNKISKNNNVGEELSMCFIWHDSEQGFDYWNKIHSRLINNTYKFENENNN